MAPPLHSEILHNVLNGATVRARRSAEGLLARAREVWRICCRAGSAAHHYEQLKSQSDEELAEKGLKRGEVPREAFEQLTKEE